MAAVAYLPSTGRRGRHHAVFHLEALARRRTERQGRSARRTLGQSRRDDATRAVRWQHGKITDLGTLGGDHSFATAINDLGAIVGSSTTADGSLHAFLWRAGRMSDLGVPGRSSSATCRAATPVARPP
ncbi:hypothetical protein [Actinoplanes solisilvae]|uniref:hypothetical protein n=1 Tax=Actinoplanes solisilvae TaxID=2486853 RepID=UPI001F0CB4B2|nr:hypothetical protein [Actinoplanes solisilvae]